MMSDYKDQELNEEQLKLLDATQDFSLNVGYDEGLMASIAVDRWGNEWDGGDNFADMDFRTVDDWN